MARFSEEQPYRRTDPVEPGRDNGEMQLPLDSPEQVHRVPDAFQDRWLRALGARQPRKWVAAGTGKGVKELRSRLESALWPVSQPPASSGEAQLSGPQKQLLEEQRRWITDNSRFVRGVSKEVRLAMKSFKRLPCLQSLTDRAEILPRAYHVATNYLAAAEFAFSEAGFGYYLSGIQRVAALEMRELWALKPMLQLALLERLAAACEAMQDAMDDGESSQAFHSAATVGAPSTVIAGLHEISQMEWESFFETHSVVNRILRSDPSGAYPRMDFESRQLYRDAVSDLAPYTNLSEGDVAKCAVLCARKAVDRKRGMNPRAAEHRSNVGYYLLDSGIHVLKRRVGYRPTIKKRVKDLILEWPEVYYVSGVELTTLVAVYLLLRHLGTIIPLIPGLLLLIPASQAAVGLMNHLTALLLLPRRLPRLDFSEGIPDDCQTLVAVPSMLLNEKEVRHIVESLEVRYLGNRDPNLHFALLTDSPDAPDEPDHEGGGLVELCSSLIEELNAKYGRDRQGGFFHLHRHQVYNPQEKTWMGWERKRGKLLDLNMLLRNEADNFPIKVGDLPVLRGIRYVITLDSDTRLPRDTAHKLIGALAHPLNRAVVDPKTNTVVEGYGILQPRVGVSIESARRSRLASIYSGETGIDIYTRAVSDVYQDLFGEGSFAGKGIYEVDIFQRVLGDRFPSNSLLSHDLIEGVYARAGLVSEVEVIDDYPSHFSAYCRRMHRWVRGDWQILRWLLPRVPNASGKLVLNPMTLLSRWKIFDNLRRSLIEMNLFLLLLAGWFFFPGGALYWTVLTIALLLIPTYVQMFFAMLRIGESASVNGFLKERMNDFVTGHLQVFVVLVFLPLKAFVMVDAIVRTLARLAITHRNLLEWETAAEAELGARKKTAVEVYLSLMPVFSVVAGVSLEFLRPASAIFASPVLALWFLSAWFTKWINRPPRKRAKQLEAQDKVFLRHAALATWRFFYEFSNQDSNWLIPDRVQESPWAVVYNISPTNLGILLNARIAAYHLGHVTLPEFVDLTEKTMRSVRRLPRFRGHFYNWYDARTLEPLSPRFISTVDSGNLAACLWTLKQACLGMQSEPLLSQELCQGIRDHLSFMLELAKEKRQPAETLSAIQKLGGMLNNPGQDSAGWIASLPGIHEQTRALLSSLRSASAEPQSENSAATDEMAWWLAETLARIENVQRMVASLAPWLLAENQNPRFPAMPSCPPLASLPSMVAELKNKLRDLPGDGGVPDALKSMNTRLEGCVQQGIELAARLEQIAAEADELFHEMDFEFLYDRRKKLLWIGYDAEADRPANSHYDLLASEARIASFIAIAKGDIKQDSWFRLGRSRVVEGGRAVLGSWSGTMFEYLMPLLWMQSYSGTLLDESMFSVVACQRNYARRKAVPWGISEAAFKERDEKGIYQYRAFGLPALAMDPDASRGLIIAPYAAFLALLVDPASAARNLERMHVMGWNGRYGFYESADYSSTMPPGKPECELVRCWMAHHQGMSLLAVCNLLGQSPLQRWFHREPQVKAAQLLLHEKITPAVPERDPSSGRRARSKQRPRKKVVTTRGATEQSGQVETISSPALSPDESALDQRMTLPGRAEDAPPPQG